jgi:hypothetical protein
MSRFINPLKIHRHIHDVIHLEPKYTTRISNYFRI